MTNRLFDLSGRTALVTGSTRGLGNAIARGLGDAGASIVLNGRSAQAVTDAASAVAQIGPMPGIVARRRAVSSLRCRAARRRSIFRNLA